MRFFDHNPRQITNAQFARLTNDMADYGDLSGIVHDLNSDQVISGNQRVRVIDLSKIEPVIYEHFDKPTKQGTVAYGYVEWMGERFNYRQVRWTLEQCIEANIKANLDGGSWDFDELASWDTDILQGVGFDDDLFKDWQRNTFALGDMLASENGQEQGKDTEPQITQTEAEKYQEIWRVKPNDIWILGQHKIIVGDCTNEQIIDRLFVDEKPRYGMHDPPYGIDVVGISAAIGGDAPFGNKKVGDIGFHGVVKTNVYAPIIGDDKPFNPIHLLKATRDCILWGANYYADKLPPKKGWLVWDKKGRDDWRDNFSDCELAWTSLPIVTRIFRHTWMGMVQEGEREKRVHPTQKPISLFEKIISELFKDEGIIIDFYLGSGTTLLACERLQRRCFGCELSPEYGAVIIQRWVDLTNGIPNLLNTLVDI